MLSKNAIPDTYQASTAIVTSTCIILSYTSYILSITQFVNNWKNSTSKSLSIFKTRTAYITWSINIGYQLNLYYVIVGSDDQVKGSFQKILLQNFRPFQSHPDLFYYHPQAVSCSDEVEVEEERDHQIIGLPSWMIILLSYSSI